MKTRSFNIIYKILHTSGNLKGIVSECRLNYPLSEREQIERNFDEDIKDRHIFTACTTGSKYRILSYRTEVL